MRKTDVVVTTIVIIIVLSVLLVSLVRLEDQNRNTFAPQSSAYAH
jgi:hypothetical protein